MLLHPASRPPLALVQERKTFDNLVKFDLMDMKVVSAAFAGSISTPNIRENKAVPTSKVTNEEVLTLAMSET